MGDKTTAPAGGKTPAHGVEELIARIRETGVREARAEAAEIIREARARAAELQAKAGAEVDELRQRARAEIERDRAAAIESLKMAARDTALQLRAQVVAGFERGLRRLVTLEMQDDDLVRRVVLALAGRVRERIGDRDIELLLPPPAGDDEVESDAGERVLRLVHGLTADALREGVELRPSRDVKAGARVRLVADHLEFELTDEAISNLFLEHLLPRFTTMLSGLD